MGHNAMTRENPGLPRGVRYLILFFQLLLIISLVKGLQLSYKAGDRTTELVTQKKKLEAEAEKLRSEAAYVSSDYYLEKVAREQLQLAREGETVVILPKTEEVEFEMAKISQKRRVEKPNYQKWLELLIH